MKKFQKPERSDVAKPEPKPGPSIYEVVAEQAKEPFKDIGEFLAAVSFLNDRGVLCSECGYKKATKRNQVKQVCEACPERGYLFQAIGKVSELDEFLCKSVREYSESVLIGATGPGT